MKTCRKCRVVKPLEDFHTYVKADRPGRVYTRGECKACSHEQRREWGEDNRERDREVKLRWQREKYQNDPEWRGARRAYCRDRAKGTPVYARGEPHDRIPCAPLREAFEASGLAMAELARRIGTDDTGLRRALAREGMPVAKATRILDALDVLPVEVGL